MWLSISATGARAQAPTSGAAPGTPSFREWAVPAPKMVRDPAADRDGSVYFAVAHDDRLVRFDPRTQRFTDWKLSAGTRPHGLGIAKDGRVFFGGNGRGTIGELEPATGKVQEHPTSRSDAKPYSLAIDASGNVWATLRGADRIAVLGRSDRRITEYPMPGEPYGIGIDARGSVWITCISTDRITILDPASERTQDIPTGPGSRPRRIAFGRDDSAWVTLYGAGRLLRLDARTRRIVRDYALPGGDNAGPYSVCVDAAGRVWVNEFQTDSIVVLDPASGSFQSFRLPMRGSGVRNATLDATGRLWYLASTHGRIGVLE